MTVLSKDQATVMSILWFLLNWSLNQAFFYLLLDHPAAEGICQNTKNDVITPSKFRP